METVRYLCDHFESEQSAPGVRNRDSFAPDELECVAAAVSSDSSSMKKDAGSSKEAEGEE
jgi:hypothetical protein